MDLLSLDPKVLEDTADMIKRYCYIQKELMNAYLNRTSNLNSEWTDEETIQPLLEEIRMLNAKVTALMEEIEAYYPSYFLRKAEEIRLRPRMK